MKIDFLNLSESNAPYASQLKEAASRVIDSGTFLNGTEIKNLEREVAEYCNAPFAIAVSNGLDAIRLIFRAYIEEGKLRAGDEVIYPANTYIASVLPVTELGLKAVPAPANPDTGNLDLSRLEEYVNEKTKAVLLVHLYGTPCWDSEVCRRLHDKGILLIEDSAQAFGAFASTPGLQESTKCGALGDAAAISFYPTKNLGALGDAGMVITADPELAKDVRTLSQYGSDRRYHNVFRGYNNRMDELQAAFLRVKLPYLDEDSRRRHNIAAIYDENIVNPEVKKPLIMPHGGQVWHQYVIRCPHRDALRQWLADNGISTDIHYPLPPQSQPCYVDYFRDAESDRALIEANELANSVLSLPIANITPAQALTISEFINRFK